MEYTLFGFKFNLINVIVFFIVGFLVATMTVCSCAKINSVGDAIKIIKGEKKTSEKHETHKQ